MASRLITSEVTATTSREQKSEMPLFKLVTIPLTGRAQDEKPKFFLIDGYRTTCGGNAYATQTHPLFGDTNLLFERKKFVLHTKAWFTRTSTAS